MLHGTTKRSSGHPHSSLSLHFVARESGAGSLGAELSPSGVAEAGHASLEATAPALGARERPHAYTNVPSAGRQTWTAQRSLRWWSWPPLFLDSLLVGPRLPAELSSPPSGLLCWAPTPHSPLPSLWPGAWDPASGETLQQGLWPLLPTSEVSHGDPSPQAPACSRPP